MQQANILIVEDESIVAMDISYQLKEMGYHVCAIADNGADAIACVEKYHPDIVLMDIIIKGAMDGIETAKHVSHRFHVPVIFLTAYSDKHTVERAVHTAPYGYLTKPFQINELRAAIEVALYKAGLEKRLRESERWFASTLRCVADAVVATDAQGNIQFLNLSAEALLEWKLAEAKGRHVDEVLYLKSPRTGARVECPILRALRNDAVVGIVFGTVMVSRNGYEFPIDDSAAPIRNDNGMIIGAVMAFRDVSFRLKIEQDLKQSAEHFRKVFDFAPAGMALVGMDGAFLELNASLCTLLGYSAAELLGMSQSDVTYSADIENEKTCLNDLIAGRTAVVQFEKRYVHKIGDEIWALVSVSLLTQGDAPMCYLYQIHDLTERKNSEYELARLAHYDALTGLANRARLCVEAEEQIRTAKRNKSGLAVVFIDVDHFKMTNDSLGHDAGDQLLREVGDRIKGAVRDMDCVARFGGDEFVLLLPDTRSAEDVAAVTHKIMSVFLKPIMLEEQAVTVGLSMGVSLYPSDGQDIRTLLKCADSALYHAKSEGRNNVQYYQADLTARVEQRMMLENDLRRAIERQEFEIYYQPILTLNEPSAIGAEALIRWHHPERGLLLPEQFITLAEETGLILTIGEWTIGEVCRQVNTWKQAGRAVTVSLNISPRQIAAGDLGRMFTKVLAATGVDPSLICLEITEHSLLQGTERNLESIAELKALGLKISIDDFGVGYSCLSYLKRFSPSQLKIDRSFTNNMVSDPEDAAIVKAIIAMGRSLNMQIVAEGVETEAQLTFIRREGCDRAQGYLYARPCPAQEFYEAWLSPKELIQPDSLSKAQSSQSLSPAIKR